ncbi:hypothetical protein C8J57DRAFT_227134 [Mycena rebaudengoi]|nr:hypothetical protein C8J57DRAFT_227134 [Mycena rebaudengoi]
MRSVVDTHSAHAPHAPGEPTIDSAAKQFKLICAGDERPIICSLSIVDQNEISVEEFAELDPEWKISFAVEVTPQMTTATAARLEASLDQGSVRILDASVSKDQTALSPVTQALLTELVTLWIDSTHSVQRTKISHRSTASTSSSSSVGSFPGPSCRRKAEFPCL